MRTHLLLGKVRHSRARPTRYELEHDVWYFALDLDELDEVPRQTRLVRRNRRAILSLRDTDHLPRPTSHLPEAFRAHLISEGIELDGGRITLITNLRVLGYVFNPASFYLCRDAAGVLVCVVVEVHNTHGERHLYTLRPEDPNPNRDGFSARMAKDFYVSPFIAVDGSYRLTVRDEADRVTIGLGLRQESGPLLATSLVLRRMPLTTRNLLWLLLRHPLVTHKTIAAIHWHALRLWLRRVPFNRHAPSSPGGTTLAAHGAKR